MFVRARKVDVIEIYPEFVSTNAVINDTFHVYDRPDILHTDHIWFILPNKLLNFFQWHDQYERDRWSVKLNQFTGNITLNRIIRIMDLDPRTFTEYHLAGERLLWKP